MHRVCAWCLHRLEEVVGFLGFLELGLQGVVVLGTKPGPFAKVVCVLNHKQSLQTLASLLLFVWLVLLLFLVVVLDFSRQDFSV